MVDRTCVVCGSIFKTYKFWAKRANGSIFCSRQCQVAGRIRHQASTLSAACKQCGKDFTRTKHRAGKMTYCSVECRKRGAGLSGENHPMWGKPHARSGSNHHNWRGGKAKGRGMTRSLIKRAKREIGKCERCGSAENLQGHHKARFSENKELQSERSNIEVICAPCHAIEHPDLAPMICFPRFKTGKTLNCTRCGKEYYRPLSAVPASKFCSMACTAAARTGTQRNGVVLICNYCRGSYYMMKSKAAESRFCSAECRFNGRKEGLWLRKTG